MDSLLLIINITAAGIVLFMILGTWKFYRIMGEPGWKGLIPVYNLYLLYQKTWKKGLFIIYLCLFVMSSFLTVHTKENMIVLIAYAMVSSVIVLMDCILKYKIAKCFGYGVLFTIGLIITPFLFYPVLGYGKREFYV